MRTKINRACKYLEFATLERNDFLKGRCRFITLTYGKNLPKHLTAKKHLSTFFKAFARRYSLNYYCWVSELQSRGAIHFHIACDTEEKIDLVWLQRTWSRIAMGCKWSKRPTTKSELVSFLISGELNWATNVKLIKYPGRYMSKYLAKDVIDAAYQKQISKKFTWIGGDRVGCSQSLNAKLKPISISNFPLDNYDEFVTACNEFCPPPGSKVTHLDFSSVYTFL